MICKALALLSLCTPDAAVPKDLVYTPLPPVTVEYPTLCATDERTGERIQIPWVGPKNYEINKRFLLAHGYSEEQIKCPLK